MSNEILSQESAVELCDSIEIYSDFFDEHNEEYVFLRKSNPALLKAYEELFTLAFSCEP